ncbi:MAG: 2-succinyl-5-enolpyruvyl-6-hydroxy-3-cyclohexene-1-carboxylic-acid synthase [Flavobacteriales bacterium]|nr:2-succinyl-5-enolpyruvyl-6-hydroxy-3-cyclohexene-1-carboxylic-acid synthase [Flavobacteriales bacterium]
MKYSSKILVEILAEAFKRKGIQDLVISPGSRNAPFIESFTSKSFFNCHSIIDERSAGFVGLGMAIRTKKPVVLICTSGSAVLNYYPAIAEAFYQEIPLIVLSADRPLWAIDNGQGQTIRQQGVLDLHCQKSLNFDGENKTKSLLNLYQKQITQSLDEAFRPIHFNVHFDEPLYETNFQKPDLSDYFSESNSHESIPNYSDFEHFSEDWKKASKKLIIIGQKSPNKAFSQAIEHLSKRSDCLILTETISNISIKNKVECIDVFLEGIKNTSDFKPDLLIQTGGAIVSKKIKFLLQKLNIKKYWSFNKNGIHPNIYGTISNSSNLCFSETFKNIEHTENLSNFGDLHLKEYHNTLKKRGQYLLNQKAFCDLKVYEFLFQNFPKSSQIHLSNSSVIRYAQLFSHSADYDFYGNRGTSGIDGSTSTAVGHAIKDLGAHFMITGDISFFYDSNALWNTQFPRNLKIILINNQGGDIFRIIPGPKKSDVREDFFATKHQTQAKGLCDSFGFDYYFCDNHIELKKQWECFLNNPNKTLFEIKISEKIGPETLSELFEHLKK